MAAVRHVPLARAVSAGFHVMITTSQLPRVHSAAWVAVHYAAYADAYDDAWTASRPVDWQVGNHPDR